MKAYKALTIIPRQLISTHLLHFCTAHKILQRFTKAVFNDKLLALSLPPDSPDFSKYSYIMKLKQQQKTNNGISQLKDSDIQTISTSLQFISSLSHKYHKNMIEASSYSQLLDSYYGHFKAQNQNDMLNKIINPVLELQYLLPTFIHTDNRQILQAIKMNQIYVLQLISKSRKIGLAEFMHIISPKIYNVTDLPLIFRYFNRYFYSSISSIKTLRQLQKVITYLIKFESTQILVLENAIKILKKQLKDDSNASDLQTCLSISNCITLLNLRANNTVKDAEMETELSKLLIKLAQKTISINNQTTTLELLQDEQKLSEVVDHLSSLLLAHIGLHLSQLKRMTSHKSEHRPQLVESLMVEQIKFLQQIDIIRAKQLVTLELFPVLIRLSLCHIQLKTSTNAVKFINSSSFFKFYSKYPTYPHLYKELLLTIDLIQFDQHCNFIHDEQFIAQIEQFQKEINHYLNQIIKQGSTASILAHYSPNTIYKEWFDEDWVWKLSGERLANRLLKMNEDYSMRNMLGMLKEDNIFLKSRMGFNKQAIMREICEQRLLNAWKIGHWQYPYYYTMFKHLPNKTEKKVDVNRFVKDTFLPQRKDQSHPDWLMLNIQIELTNINRG